MISPKPRMPRTLAFVGVCVLAMTACAKKESATTTQDVTSAPLGVGPCGSSGACGEGRGGGPRRAGGGPLMACPRSQGPLPDAVRTAIERALAEERAAEARYTAARKSLDGAMPFRQLERSERRHALALEQLLGQHGVAVPEPSARTAPATNVLRDECAAGVEVEKKTIALYDELLARELPEDVRCVFTYLRVASRERHLPALEGCAARR